MLHRRRPLPFFGELPLQVQVALLGSEAVDSAAFDCPGQLAFMSLVLAEAVEAFCHVSVDPGEAVQILARSHPVHRRFLL